MAEQVVRDIKPYIEAGNLDACKEQVAQLRVEYEDVPWDYMFQKVYLHACLKKKVNIVEWLLEVYKELEPVDQIALRTVFPYGRALLRKSS